MQDFEYVSCYFQNSLQSDVYTCWQPGTEGSSLKQQNVRCKAVIHSAAVSRLTVLDTAAGLAHS